MKSTIKLFSLLILVMLLSSCFVRTPKIAIPDVPPPPKALAKPPQVALVLGAGGARGYAHIGVIKVLHQAGVPINLIVGASAGSIIGSLYADRGSVSGVENAMMSAGYFSFIDVSVPITLSGAITGAAFEDFMLKHLNAKTFRQLKIKFVVVTTDMKTGKPYVIQSGPVVPAVDASAALPGLVQPVYIYGHTLIDGGVSDPVAVDVAKRFHPKVIIAVNIGQQLTPRIPTTAYSIYNRAHSIMWTRLEQYSTQGANVIIRPRVGQAGTFDLSDKRKLIQEGMDAARKALPKIKRILAAKGIALHPRRTRGQV